MHLCEESLEDGCEESQPLVCSIGTRLVARMLADLHAVSNLSTLEHHRPASLCHRLLGEEHHTHRGLPYDRVRSRLGHLP